MNRKAVALVAVGSVAGFAGFAQSQIIEYMLSGTLDANAGDSEGLDGASLTAVLHFDETSTYQDRFGLANVVAIPGSPMVTIAGSSIGGNNATTPYNSDLSFYATFAGTFTEPDGLHTEFNLGNGALMQFTMNTTATAGSGDVFIGGPIELDDFVPSSYAGSGLVNLGTGEGYTFSNVSITATIVPAPASAALLAIGGLAATRRRRA